MNVGLIGCGTIGIALIETINQITGWKLAYIADIKTSSIQKAQDASRDQPEVVDFERLVEQSELIIEAAEPGAVREILHHKAFDQPGKKLVVLSVNGLLANMDEYQALQHAEVFIPSGAVAGLDSFTAVADLIESLSITSSKPPAGLAGAPYVVEHSIDMTQLARPQTIFTGTLAQAMKGFPQNMNVAAALALATGRTDFSITVVADPTTTTNNHTIEATGPFGTISCTTKNKPSKNPKTSYLAVASAQRMLHMIAQRP